MSRTISRSGEYHADDHAPMTWLSDDGLEHGAGRSIVSVSIPDPLSTTKEIGVHKVYDVKC